MKKLRAKNRTEVAIKAQAAVAKPGLLRIATQLGPIAAPKLFARPTPFDMIASVRFWYHRQKW